MPRFVITPGAQSPKHAAFVKKLIQEFTASSANLQPLILEELVPSTKSRHVRVIWDRWKELDDEERSAVIIDAYTEAEGAVAAAEITIAEGVTPHEALALGLLSFKVVPARKQKNYSMGFNAYQDAQEKEARKTLLGPKATELRYARIEDAQQAYERLHEAFPHSSWAIVQEQATES
jgi:hypothetical protein